MNPFAIYFPQYYPTDTNDAAWGKGFTDWALVANANLRNLWNRRAPARGFYDGASAAVHSRQIEEARAAGMGGFGVYHYWFYTHQELSAFENTLIHSGEGATDFPWFLIWATEGWSKRWLGDSTPLVNLTREPSDTEVQLHCDYLVKCFERPNYWRWEGKPLFVWYNLAHFLHPERVVSTYREQLFRRGFDVATAHFVKHPFDIQYSKFTDASYLFEPRLFFGTRSAVRGNRIQMGKRHAPEMAGGGRSR
ncbi:MAG: glycoside hydrolase family 99-like domain-containing protein [Steroidobacteraceae bacterium]